MTWPAFGKSIRGCGRVYQVRHDDGSESYVFSAYQVWRPGSFTTVKALLLAARRMDNAQLQALQDKCAPKSITLETVREVLRPSEGAS